MKRKIVSYSNRSRNQKLIILKNLTKLLTSNTILFQLEDKDLLDILIQIKDFESFKSKMLQFLKNIEKEIIPSVYNGFAELGIHFRNDHIVFYFDKEDHEFFRSGNAIRDGQNEYAILINLHSFLLNGFTLNQSIVLGGFKHETAHNLFRASIENIYSNHSQFMGKLQAGFDDYPLISNLQFDFTQYNEITEAMVSAIKEIVVNWLSFNTSSGEDIKTILDFQVSECFKAFDTINDPEILKANLYILAQYAALIKYAKLELSSLYKKVFSILEKNKKANKFYIDMEKFVTRLQLKKNIVISNELLARKSPVLKMPEKDGDPFIYGNEKLYLLNKKLLSPFLSRFGLDVPIKIKIPSAIATTELIKKLLASITEDTQIDLLFGNHVNEGVSTFGEVMDHIKQTGKGLAAGKILFSLNIYEEKGNESLALNVFIPEVELQKTDLRFVEFQDPVGCQAGYLPVSLVEISRSVSNANEEYIDIIRRR